MEEDFREIVANYIEIGKELVYLSYKECAEFALSKDNTIILMEETLKAHGKKDVEMPPKVGLNVTSNLIKNDKTSTFVYGGYATMPAYVGNGHVCGVKWVSGYPDNRNNFGLPQTTGLTILSDHLSGFPITIMDATFVTPERTAAVTMVGIKYLANKDSDTFGMIGCGVVGKKHVEYAMSVLPHLKRIYIYDNFEPAMDQLIEEIQPKLDIQILKAATYEEIVKKSQVIVSATAMLSDVEPKINESWISNGHTVFLCDAHTLYGNRAMEKADKYIVDSLETHRLREKTGSYVLPKVYGELGEIVAGMKLGRESRDEIIISNNLGMACEDMALSAEICTKALANGMGQKLRL